MSQEGSQIICRRCGESIPLDAGACPHCGKEIQGTAGPAVAIVVGLLLVGAAVLVGSSLYVFGALGFIAAATGGYLLYDKRQRIQEATEQASQQAAESADADDSESIF